MSKHVLFYDEPGAVTVDVDGEGDDNGGTPMTADFADSLKKKRKQTLRWLALLFWGTTALLILELLLGWTAGAVTLLADAAHSGADSISYLLNFVVEWLKLAPRLRKSKRGITPQRAAAIAKIIDTIGSFISLVTLLFATWWGTTEALNRLQMPIKDSGHVGSALLIFAITSTAANVGMLMMYRRLSGKSSKGTDSAELNPTSIGRETPKEAEVDLQEDVPWKADYCPPCDLSLSEDVGDNETSASPAADTLVDAPECPAGAEDVDEDGMMTTLHMVLHPGCSCAVKIQYKSEKSTTDPSVEKKPESQQTDSTTPKASRNLNVVAAMLHLVTDMLRSLLILIVALLIQFELVKDAEYTDAVCALVVAVLILVGSLALLLRVAARLKPCFQKFCLLATPKT
eukprot:TRINITY_DN69310_c0_g1_i1.p1 TRINITY_DN69310_c0_g1~~TRINITY_DN69310_c0_g1_i1.p1  ORF type:complete len:400 (+),score=69.15 TRINITY_DN69310_c0_g1_i1:89-1288(+)